VHALALIMPVPVLDGVDDGLAHGDVDPVPGVFVQACHARNLIADDLHEIEHLERAMEVEADGVAVTHRSM
jgi:hypothetical protein